MALARTLNVGLVQINNSFERQCYLPYTVGMLQAYAQQQAEAWQQALAEQQRQDRIKLYNRKLHARGIIAARGFTRALDKLGHEADAAIVSEIRERFENTLPE